MMFNDLVWFCLYFASLSFGDERQRDIGASPDESGLMYEVLGPNRAAEISATTGDDGSNEIFNLLANVVPANSSANFNDSNANITFLTELSTNDDFIRANNTSLILLHTSTVTNIQSVVENHSSDQPPTSKTLENLPPTKEYNGASTSETLENLPPTKEYNDASALISERPCRWALIKKQPPPAGGNPILRWAIIILAFALVIAIIIAFLVVALDKRPIEANNEEMIPLKAVTDE